ncbi:MAG: AI-2E family transporter [Oscillospiraceae bacterium]|nr:AI-2E family transporter [Oscillospiraceae bacterium]
MDRRLYRQLLCLIAFTLLLYAALCRIEPIWQAVCFFLRILTPFFLGCLIAFILRGPVCGMEARLRAFEKLKNGRAASILALVLVYLVLACLALLFIAVLGPQLAKSLMHFSENLPRYTATISTFLEDLYRRLQIESLAGMDFATVSGQVASWAETLFSGLMPRLMGVTGGVFMTIGNWSMGFVISVYLLAERRHLSAQCRRMASAWLPKRIFNKARRVLRVSFTIFSGFVSGQLREMCILGILCFIGMSILGFPYALLISSIVGVANILPIIGPLIGMIAGAFLLLVEAPRQFIWFIVFLFCLQQIEATFIYPRVVGSKIGLPPLWVAVGVMAGGGLAGIWGMMLALPVVSVLYSLLREETARRLSFRDRQKKRMP